MSDLPPRDLSRCPARLLCGFQENAAERAAEVPRRACFVLDLIDEAAAIATYERYHQPGSVPQTVLDDMSQQGVLRMEIWRAGPRLTMVAEFADDYPRSPRTPAVEAELDAWEAAMDAFQRRLPFVSPDIKWVEMRRIFNSRDHGV